MNFEDFTILFHEAVAAIENNKVAEIDLHADFPERISVDVTVRRDSFILRPSNPDEG